jgi:hypothetical protein
MNDAYSSYIDGKLEEAVALLLKTIQEAPKVLAAAYCPLSVACCLLSATFCSLLGWLAMLFILAATRSLLTGRLFASLC